MRILNWSRLTRLLPLILLSTTASLSGATLELAPPVGAAYEAVDRGRFKTEVARKDGVFEQVIETGAREVGRVQDTSGGEIRIASYTLSSVLKVNGETRKGGLPGTDAPSLRIYSPRGELLGTYPETLKAGDLRELSVSLPQGNLKKGMKWRQTFQLSGGKGAASIPVRAEFQLVGTKKVSGRKAYEIQGKLGVAATRTPSGYIAASGSGKAALFIDVRTGLPLQKTLKMHVEQVREDPISLGIERAGGRKLGMYIDLVRQYRVVYLGKDKPPGLKKLETR